MRGTLNPLGIVSVLALSVGLGAVEWVNAQSLTWLGTLGRSWSEAYGVSADGTVVVGEAGAENVGGHHQL